MPQLIELSQPLDDDDDYEEKDYYEADEKVVAALAIPSYTPV